MFGWCCLKSSTANSCQSENFENIDNNRNCIWFSLSKRIVISKTWYSNLYYLPGTLGPNCCSNWNSLCIMPPFHISWSHQRLRYHAFELNCTRWLNEYIPVSKYSNFWYWNEISTLSHKTYHLTFIIEIKLSKAQNLDRWYYFRFKVILVIYIRM